MMRFIKLLGTILKWKLIILFFPLSLIFVAYYRQQKAKRIYYGTDD